MQDTLLTIREKDMKNSSSEAMSSKKWSEKSWGTHWCRVTSFEGPMPTLCFKGRCWLSLSPGPSKLSRKLPTWVGLPSSGWNWYPFDNEVRIGWVVPEVCLHCSPKLADLEFRAPACEAMFLLRFHWSPHRELSFSWSRKDSTVDSQSERPDSWSSTEQGSSDRTHGRKINGCEGRSTESIRGASKCSKWNICGRCRASGQGSRTSSWNDRGACATARKPIASTLGPQNQEKWWKMKVLNPEYMGYNP